MPAFPILLSALLVLWLGYRYYGRFLAERVAALDDGRVTPAVRLHDGQNYHATHRVVLFGHHFAAISGAGPLIGPVLAAQFGYLPGLLWLVVGVVLAGAVQDFLVLVASVRYEGRSLVQIARAELGPTAGVAGGIAVLFVLVIALAGLGIVVVQALHESAWGTFTLAMTVPIAFAMGIYTQWVRPGRIGESTVFGVAGLLFAVGAGRWVAASPYASWFLLSKLQLTCALGAYGFAASVLPVWLLLCPRDYLSSFLKIGTIALLVVGVLYVNPTLRLPALTPYIHGGGPILSGKVFPFVFITIMCGAISGFHALVASGTTPKMVARERDCRSIGYGAMLVEGLVGIVALVAVASLAPGDYFAINVSPEKFSSLKLFGYHIEELPVIESQIEEKVAGRTGGAVSLAVGMAKIFSSLPGLRSLLAYWYHFAIMFEALFILTTIDTGTRVARFVFQELLGKLRPAWGRPDSRWSAVATSLFTVTAWGSLIATGSISTIWPMFGIANQLLAILALATVSTILVREGKRRYLPVTVAPMCFVLLTTTSGAWELIGGTFWPWMQSADLGNRWRGGIDIAVTLVLFACLGVLLTLAVAKWRAKAPAVAAGAEVPPKRLYS